MTRNTQKNLAAYEGTWFGNIHGNNRQDPWSKKEVSYDRLVGSSSPPSPTTQSYRKWRFPGSVRIAPNWRRFVHAFCLCTLPIELRGLFQGLPSTKRTPSGIRSILMRTGTR
jgi:hypothetical protein